MKVQYAAAIALCTAIRLDMAARWPEKVLNEKLNLIVTDLEADDVDALTGEPRATYDAMLAASKAGEEITVEMPAKGEKPAGKGKAAPAPAKAKVGKEKPATKPASTPAKAPAAAKPAKAKAEPAKDKFGCRLGSQAAAINETISKKWATEEEIVKATKLTTARIRGHMQHLVKIKVVEADEKKGWRAV